MRYIKSFSNADAIQAAVDNNTLGKPYVALNEATGAIDWNSKEKGPSAQYFTIEVISAGTVNLTLADGVNMQYSVDSGETWQSNASINAQPGDKIMYKGTNNTLAPQAFISYSVFSGSSAYYNAYGNIMSLLYGDNFIGQTSLADNVTAIFYNLFSNSHLVDASNLILPATTFGQGPYNGMFENCTNLTAAPALPATTLTMDCYANMFRGCTSLTAAPELPATSLASSCYSQMFMGCTSLTTAPSELPATTLEERCYYRMFNGCTSLATAPELPATTLTKYCYASMFQGCTSLTSTPELPAATLKINSYFYMFSGCTSLNYVKCLATDISASNCTYEWVAGVAASGTFVRDASMTGWTTGDSGIPSGWVTLDNPTHTTGVWLKAGSTEIEGVLSDGTYNFTPTEGIEGDASLVIDGKYMVVNGNACGFYHDCMGEINDSEGGPDPNSGGFIKCSEVETGVYKVGHAIPIIGATYNPSSSTLTLNTHYQEECPEPEPEPGEPEEEPGEN